MEDKTVLNKSYKSELAINEEERTVTQYISTNVEDRGQDIVVPKGVKLENYRKNPMVLWGHDQHSLPIAKSLWEKIEKDGVLSKAKFATHPMAEDVFKLVRGGFVNTVSIGFIPLKVSEKDTGDTIERWGMTIPKIIRSIDEWELLEYSYVNVPMNPDANVLRELESIEMKSFLMKELEASEQAKVTNDVLEEYKSLLESFKEEFNNTLTLKTTELFTGFDEKLIELSNTINQSVDEKNQSLTNELSTISTKLSEIVDDITHLKNSEAQKAMKSIVENVVVGAIKKHKGNVDHLFDKK